MTYRSVQRFGYSAIVLTAFAITLLMQTGAYAQHAKLVLFGEPTEAAAEAPASQQFVHPVTSPYYHEDSFVTSDVRLWYVRHSLPGAFGDGEAHLYAAQVRLALTHELQFLAYKDGYVDYNSSLTGSSEGKMDIAAGVKWNFIQDWENQFHMAVGVGYEIASGDGRVMQNDDEWRIWGSINKGFDELHLGATVNVFIADDSSQGLGNSDWLSWHLHADYYVCDWFSPVLEFNGYHVLDEGTIGGATPLPVTGVDVANLGGDHDEPVITAALGAEFRPFEAYDVAVRAAYEPALTDNNDLWGSRWTTSLIWSF